MAKPLKLLSPLGRTYSWVFRSYPGRPGQMLRVIAVTLVNSIVVAAFVVAVTFFLIRYILGDPAYQYAMTQNGGQPPSPAAVASARVTLGVNSPIMVQFWHYLTGLLHGSLGNSFQAGHLPVGSLIWNGFSTTLVLTGLTLTVSAVTGTALGLWLAVVRSRVVDNILRIFAMAGLAAPPALVGLVLIWLTSALGGILPAGGWAYSYPANFKFLVLPVIALCTGFMPAILRVVRERARATLAEPHIDAARTRGIPPIVLMVGHVLPECVAPLLRFLALNTAWLLSGAVVVEVVFDLPGIGRVLVSAVTADDYPTIQACAMLTGLVVVVCFALSQIGSALVDPRTRS